MNLNSKRIAAALLTLAAFTGVLIKDIPFSASEGKSGDDHLLSDNSLGDVGLPSTGAELTVPPAHSSPAVSNEQPVSFNGASSGVLNVPGSGSLPDRSGLRPQRDLPNPVGASPKSSNSSQSGNGPFLSASGQGGAKETPGFGGGNGGGTGGGAPGSGGSGGSNNPGTPTGGGDKTGGSTPESPVVNKPDDPKDNPSTGETPESPDVNPTPKDVTDDKGPGPSNGADFDSPTGDENVPGPAVIPPWVDDSLPIPTDTFPNSDVPNSPTDGGSHNVPDSGSSVTLLATALMAVLALRRKAKVL